MLAQESLFLFGLIRRTPEEEKIMGKKVTYVNCLRGLSMALCVLLLLLSAGCGKSYRKGTEHSLMFSAKCSNWGEVSLEEDFWADTQWMVYYDGTVECFDEYNLSGATESVTWQLSDSDFETLYRLLDKKFLQYKKGTEACDGAAWSMQYYDADGNEKHSFHGYIYGISALEEIEELIAKPEDVKEEQI